MALTKVNSTLVDGAINTDASGNVGIGTSSPSTLLQLNTASSAANVFNITGGSSQVFNIGLNNGNGGPYVYSTSNHALRFGTNDIERMRINSSGDVFINATSYPVVGTEKFGVNGGSNVAAAFTTSSTSLPATFISCSANGSVTFVRFSSGSGGDTRGNITWNGSNVVYGTSSDYRLKENIAPMTGALAVVGQLKPCSYTWKETGIESQGFIAHELAEVCPDAVVGEKDAVDEEGKPVYQCIDTSFLVATLTAAIQEQQAIITDLTTRLEALEAK